MSSCVFCDIIFGSEPASLIYEDDETVAFMDLFPIHAGHALVAPREHVKDLSDCSPQLAAHVFQVSALLGPAIARATAAQGFNVWSANGKAAGQEVFHLHVHVLPRFDDDTFGLRFPKGYPTPASRDQLEDMAAKIRRVVRG